MASRANRKQRQAIKEQKEARKFFAIVGVSTLVLLVLLFFIFQAS